MQVQITVKMQCAGSYVIDTPSGTYQLANCPIDTSDPFMKGFRAGPRWMLTYPGRYSADDVFTTKRDAVAYIQTREQEKADEAAKKETTVTDTQRFVVAQLGPNYFVTRDTVTELDVSVSKSRYGAQHIADCLTDGTMVLNELGYAIAAKAPILPTVRETGQFGVFDESGECIDGPYWTRESAEKQAQTHRDDDPDGEYTIRAMCPDHEGQPQDGCEECFADSEAAA